MSLRKLYSRIMPASKYQINKKAAQFEKENEEIIKLQKKLDEKTAKLSKKIAAYEAKNKVSFENVMKHNESLVQQSENRVLTDVKNSVQTAENKLEKFVESSIKKESDKKFGEITKILEEDSKSVEKFSTDNENLLKNVLFKLNQQEMMLKNICYEQKRAVIEETDENSTSSQVAEQNQIPVVLSADNNYGIPMLVTIASALQNKADTTYFKFYILISEDFSDTLKGMIDKVLAMYPGNAAEYIVMGDEFSGAYVGIEHITVPTYYRLKIPQLLSQVDKCIYLDVDLIVKQDLGKLFDVDIEEDYAAGVRALGYYSSEDRMIKRAEYLGIENVNDYINAGVLLLNLKKIRENNLQARFMELLDKNFNSQDQDILNVAFFGKIKILPFAYNVMTKYELFNESAYEETEFIRRCLTKEDWDEGRQNPIIIHYADKEKPWDKFEAVYSGEWWNVVSSLPSEIAVYVYDRYISKLIYQAGKK